MKAITRTTTPDDPMMSIMREQSSALPFLGYLAKFLFGMETVNLFLSLSQSLRAASSSQLGSSL